jgi:hypothetical protein
MQSHPTLRRLLGPSHQIDIDRAGGTQSLLLNAISHPTTPVPNQGLAQRRETENSLPFHQGGYGQ